MLTSGLSSLAASLASSASVAVSSAQLHAMLSHTVGHLPKKVSQLWHSVSYDTLPAALSTTKTPIDLDTAVLNAVERGSVDILRLLLDYGASVHSTAADGHSILFVAAARGHLGVATELIRRGALPTVSMVDAAIGIHDAAMVALLLSHVPTITAEQLHVAIAAAAPPAIFSTLLTAVGLDESDVDDVEVDDKTLLMHAAATGQSKIVDLLLDLGADVFAENSAGDTALHLACAGGHVHATYVLLQAGADMDMPNAADETPFDVALPVLKPLLDCNGVVDEAIVVAWQRQRETRGSLVPVRIIQKRAAKYANLNLAPVCEDSAL